MIMNPTSICINKTEPWEYEFGEHKILLYLSMLQTYPIMSSAKYTSHCLYVPLSSVDWRVQRILTHCGGSKLPTNPTLYYIVSAFHSFTYFIALRLSLKILMIFKTWKSLYFWSVLHDTTLHHWILISSLHSIRYVFALDHPMTYSIRQVAYCYGSWNNHNNNRGRS